MTLPRKWPVPAMGQVLAVTKPYPEGWISLTFWPSDTGFHFVYQAISDRRMMEAASENPVAASWAQHTCFRAAGPLPWSGLTACLVCLRVGGRKFFRGKRPDRIRAVDPEFADSGVDAAFVAASLSSTAI